MPCKLAEIARKYDGYKDKDDITAFEHRIFRLRTPDNGGSILSCPLTPPRLKCMSINNVINAIYTRNSFLKSHYDNLKTFFRN